MTTMRGVVRLIGIVVSIGLADSLNPSTVAPALFMATEEEGARTVLRFTVGVFAVYLLGGLVVALGPGQLLLSLVPHPSHVTRYVLELIAGAAMLLGGGLLRRFREPLSRRALPSFSGERRGGPTLLGASIMGVELPTAFPYFAAIAAVVGSGDAIWRQVVLLVLYNVCFVVPLIGIVVVLRRFGPEGRARLAASRTWLQAHWPTLLAGLAIGAGAIVLTLGATGLIARGHSGVARLLRRVRGE